MAKRNKPQIRFKGFDGEWEEKFIQDVCSIGTGKSNTQDQVEHGEYPFFIRSDKPVKSNRYLYDCEAVITIGDGNIGKVFHYINGKFDLHQRCYKMTNFDDVTGKYFYFYFSSNFYNRVIRMSAKATVDSVRLDMIAEMPIIYPKNHLEQTRIASLFTALDKQISCSEAKLDKLRTIKKTLLKKMFASQGEKTPQIRFKGFEGEWEEKRLGEIANRLTRRNSNNECDLPLTIASQYGLIDQREYFNFRVASSNITNYFLLKKGEFAYNKSTSDGYPWGSIKRLDRYPMGVLSTLYIIFELKNNSVVSDYVVSYYNTKNWYNSVKKIAAEGARNHGLLNISPIEFFTTNIQLPQNKKEQTKIASLFTALDKQISCQEKKIEKLKAVKKTLLKKMFV